MAFQYVMAWLFCFLYACLISFTIGSSLILKAFINDLTTILKSINESARDEEDESEIAEKFNVFIKFHSTVKQLETTENTNLFLYVVKFQRDICFRLASDDSDLIQPSNMVFFTWCVVQICAKMLMTQVEIVTCYRF